MDKIPNFELIDAAAILTEWDEFKNIDFKNLTVIDGRNVFNEASYSIGKQNISQKWKGLF